MNKLFTAVVGVFAFSVIGTSQAFAVDAAPVDFRACTFQEGKTMKDLDKVTAKFREYANKNDFDYAAWTLKPQYMTAAGFDIGWLGAWPSGEAFGVSMERWTTDGGALQAEFDQVMDCSGRHEMAISMPINAPEGTPEDGVLMFYPCNVHEGKTTADAYQAHLDAGTQMKALGSLAVSWFFEPAAGASPDHPDYYHVIGFYRYSDLGATMDLFVNGGGREAQQKILSKVSTCDSPAIFDAISVRARDER